MPFVITRGLWRVMGLTREEGDGEKEAERKRKRTD